MASATRALPRRLIVAALLLGGCAASTPSSALPAPSAPEAVPSASDEPAATASPTAAPPSQAAATPSPIALDIATPGRPYDADAILDLMRASTRPGGVPDQLETAAVAQAVAAEIWTLGGMPWTDASAGGSCGPASCTLEIGGIPAGAQGEDLYVFGVDPASGSVSVVETSLRGVAPALVEELDAITRQLWSGDLSTLGLTSVSWLPPPGDRRFRLSYRGGAEEGSPAHDLLLDLDAASVEEP